MGFDLGSNPIWDLGFFRVYVSPKIYTMSFCCYFSVKNSFAWWFCKTKFFLTTMYLFDVLFQYRECMNSLLQLCLFWLKTQRLVSILKVELCKFSLLTQLFTHIFCCLEGLRVSTFQLYFKSYVSLKVLLSIHREMARFLMDPNFLEHDAL